MMVRGFEKGRGTVCSLLSRLTGVLMMALPFMAQATPREIKSLSAVTQIVDRIVAEGIAPRDILVLWDVDMTLVKPENPETQMPNIQTHRTLFKDILGRLTPYEQDLTLCWGIYHSVLSASEADLPARIQALQKLGVRTMALTARLPGPLRGTKPFLLETKQQLQELGFDFSGALPELTGMVFEDLPSFGGRHPMVMDGILTSNGTKGGAHKGTVLVHFLKKLRGKWHPKVVLMIDDRAAHVDEVETALEAYDPTIRVIGLVYTGAAGYTSGSANAAGFRDFWERQVALAQGRG